VQFSRSYSLSPFLDVKKSAERAPNPQVPVVPCFLPTISRTRAPLPDRRGSPYEIAESRRILIP